MQWSELNLNRFGFKSEPDLVDAGSVQMSADSNNATPDNVVIGNKSGEKEANQVVTATVITDCVIKTSSQPARVEISGNDIFFYQDTTGGASPVVGNTATLNWVRADDNTKMFTMVSRASVFNDLDNVWSFYSTPPASGKHNWMFFGRDGDSSNPFRNVGNISMAVDWKSAEAFANSNGRWSVEVSKDSSSTENYVTIATGEDRQLGNLPLYPAGGIYAILIGAQSGPAGLAYRDVTLPLASQVNLAFYMNKWSEVTLAANLIPETNYAASPLAGYDIGSSSYKIKDVWVGRNIDVDGNCEADAYSAGGFAGINAFVDYLDAGSATNYLTFVKGLLVLKLP